MIGSDLLERLGGRVPGGSSAQTLAEHYVDRWHRELWPSAARPPEVMDLGCGPGDSVEHFRRLDPRVRWIGLDLPRSPEVASRTRTDAEFRTFDGVSVPLPDASLDLVLSKQVLEHVERPAALLGEVGRVLRPGGYLVGSTSQLEPYHSLSQWNYTPVGLARLIEEGGLEVLELRPGIDALTLILRRGLGGPAAFNRFWARDSPLNRAIGLYARATRRSAREANAIKLLFCGQFAFLARRR